MAWQGQSGPEDSIGGVSAFVGMDSTPMAADMARVKGMLDDLSAKFGVAARAATATAAATTRLDAGMRGVSGGAGMAAMKFMVLGQFVDDMQYGFSAIVNQIPQLTMAFGGSMGLAGGLAIAGVAVNQLSRNWHELTVAIGMGGTETAAEEMDRLGKATRKTADEQERLNKLKGAEQAHKEVVGMGTEAEKKVQAGVARAIAEAGGRDVMKSLLEIEQPFHKMTPQDEAAIAEARKRDARLAAGGGLGAGINPVEVIEGAIKGNEKEVRKRIADRLAAENTQSVDELLDRAMHGEGAEGERARKRLLNIVEKNPGAFRPGLEDDLREATPQGIANAKDQAESDRRLARRLAERQEREGWEAEGRRNVRKFERERQEEAEEERKVGERLAREEPTNEEVRAQIEKKIVEDDQVLGKRLIRDDLRRAEREEKRVRDEEGLARLGERGSDLDWRLALLMNPEKVGQSMAIGQYERSFKATTGMSEEVKRLHAIEEVLKDIERNNANIKIIGVKKP